MIITNRHSLCCNQIEIYIYILGVAALSYVFYLIGNFFEISYQIKNSPRNRAMTEMKMLLTRPATGGDSYGYNSFLFNRKFLRNFLLNKNSPRDAQLAAGEFALRHRSRAKCVRAHTFLIDRRLLRGNLDYKKDNNRNGF